MPLVHAPSGKYLRWGFLSKGSAAKRRLLRPLRYARAIRRSLRAHPSYPRVHSQNEDCYALAPTNEHAPRCDSGTCAATGLRPSLGYA